MIIGIDPALHNIGWCVITNEEKPQFIASGVISIKTKSTQERWENILTSFSEIIQKYEIEKAGIECPFVNSNPQTSLTLGVAKGLCMAKFIEHKIPISIFTPSHVKKIITGSGRAEKTQVQYMVKQILNLTEDFKKLDESDAAGVAICCLMD